MGGGALESLGIPTADEPPQLLRLLVAPALADTRQKMSRNVPELTWYLPSLNFAVGHLCVDINAWCPERWGLLVKSRPGAVQVRRNFSPPYSFGLVGV